MVILLLELLKNSLNSWIVFVFTQNWSFFKGCCAFITKKYLEALNFGYFVIYITIKSGLNVVQSKFLLISCIFTGLSRNSNRARHLGMRSSLNHRAETVLVTYFSWYSNIREEVYFFCCAHQTNIYGDFAFRTSQKSLNIWIVFVFT